MQLTFTENQHALRKTLREYFAELITPALRKEIQSSTGEGGGPLFWQAMKQLGQDGWIGVGWSKQWGGRGLTEIEQMIFIDEVMRSGFPFPFLTTESVGPILAQHAVQRIKSLVLPKILAGKMMIAIAYSEPAAGTDLAALQTTAKRDGNEWVINGQKIFTSLAQHSEYVWLAARTNTNPEIKKHRGISIFLVPTKSAGFSLTPIHTLGDVRTNTTYYDNVRIPLDHLIGEVDAGWQLITSQLNRERLSLVNSGAITQLLTDVIDWAREKKQADHSLLIEQPWVQINLAKVRAGVEALQLLCYRQAWAMTQGQLEMADASAVKVYGTEFFIEAYRLLAEILGQSSTIHYSSAHAVLRGRLEELYRTASIITFGGGTNEIQRDIIAAAGLWMPRAKR